MIIFNSQKNFLIIISFISLIILASAYILEYFVNLPPCKLCIYQRVPYFFIIFLCVISYFFKNKKFLFYLIFICLIIGLLISGFHSLVERGVVSYEMSCSSNTSDFENIDELRAFLDQTSIAKCDEIIFFFAGVSLANFNLIISFFLIIFNLDTLRKYEKVFKKTN